MRFKHFLFVVPLLAAVLVGCTETSDPEEPTPTEPTEPEEPTQEEPTQEEPAVEPKVALTEEEVKEILEAFDTSSVNEYTHHYRYVNGTVYNEAEVVKYKIYDQGFDGTSTAYSNLATTSSLTSTDYVTGRYASYILDDDYYIVGLQGASETDDYYQYNERNMYVDHANGLSSLEDLFVDVSNAFLNSSEYWSSADDFTVTSMSNQVNSAGNIEVKIGASAPEDSANWVRAETSEVVVEVDAVTLEVVSMSSYIAMYGWGTVALIDNNATYYQYHRVDNISYGDAYTDEIEPFDVSSFSEDRILNAPAQVVEGIEEGEISVETAQQIIENRDAYVVGCVSSTEESNPLTSYNHPGYDNTNVGETRVVTTKQRYADYVLESTTEYIPTNDAYESYSETTKYEATEEGIVVSGATTNFISRDDVTSMETYFSAVPAYDDVVTIAEALSYFVNNGTEATSQWNMYYYYVTDFSASKVGNTISISFKYRTVLATAYSTVWDDTYQYDFVIEDDFMTSFKAYKETDESYTNYTMTKGELTAYPSE